MMASWTTSNFETPPQAKKILLVEDEGLIAMELKRRLEGFGYHIPGVASNADDAFRMACSFAPDLILMDICLKGDRDGIAAAAQVREELDIPVVFLTANADPETVRRASAAGSFGYIVKPYGSANLRANIDMAFSQKQAERSLRKSEAWLAATLRSVGDAVIAADPEGNITFLNSEAERLTGWLAADAKGIPLSRVLPAVSGRGQYWLSPPGSQTPWLIETVVTPTACDGVPLGVVIAFRVIGSPPAIATTPETDTYLRALFEQTAVGLTKVSPDGRFLLVNNRFCEMLGYSREELTRKTVGEITHPDDLAVSGHNMDTLLRGETSTYSLEKRYLHKDGSLVWAKLTVSSVPNAHGQPDYLIAVIEDITRRKQLDEQLRQSEARFQALLETSPVGIVKTRRGGRVLKANDAFYSLLGWDRDSFARAEMDLRKLTPPDWMERSLANVENSIETRRAVIYEKEFLRRDGSRVPVLIGLGFSDGPDAEALVFVLDLSAQKRDQEKLRRSEETLRFALKAANAGIADINMDTLEYEWSAENYAICGLPPGTPITRSTWRSLLFPEDLAAAVAAYDHAVETAGTYDVEFRIRRDGAIRWIAAKGGCQYDAAGRPARFTSICIDITRRKLAEERFRLVVEAAPNAMIMIGDDGLIALVNSQTEKLFGYCRDELLGQPVEMLVPERYRQDHVSHRAAFFTQPSAREMGEGRDLFGRRRDGAEFPVEIGLSPVQTAEGQSVLASIIDITGRKAAEAALRESEAKFRQLADAMPQIVWTARPDGTRDYYNERWYAFTGFSPGDTSDESRNRILHPDDLPNSVDIWRAAVASGEAFEIRYRFRDRASATWRWYLGRGLPIRENGVIVKWVGTCTDVDEHHRLSEELEQRIEQRTHALRLSLREKETLLKEVHHRVRNNLQIVCSLLSMQIECVGEASSGPLTDAHRRVLAMALIHERIYRSEALSDVDFGDYIEQLAANLFETYCVDTSRIGLRLSVEPIRLTVDSAVPCGLILNELLSNALKHAFAGDGMAAGGKGTVSVTFRKTAENLLEMSVADDGAGLPDSFDLETRQSLGLQVVRALVDQLGAKLEIGREGGTSMSVLWPV